INIWSDEKIQQMLEGATRNKEIFEEIARRLMRHGIDRDWKQCRTKYKNLKYEYRALQKENEHHGNPRRKMRFYDEVDCILRRQPLGPSSWGCESSSFLSGTKNFRLKKANFHEFNLHHSLERKKNKNRAVMFM
uniref:Myb/SANT-like DNA-binding domain-containing protein n=1 Tax=Apteryx owenii TaxID=8824 RepID=A0A8B9P8F2_APTOW